ncbi:MAG: SDR family oxidoreductase, partial [Desulfobulbaceae bacterium]|nr:SDR family oxidoreductase [Desulfobulbaceae bacterium]
PAGKVALVLGAAKGIGKEIGLTLARAGARVVFTYFDWPEESKRLQEEVAQLAGDHLTLRVDLRDPQQVEALITRVREHYSALNILINNIERGGMPVVHGPYTPEQWDLEMETTVKAKWWVCLHALPLMKAGGDGVVVTLSSIAGLVGRSGPAGLIFNDGYSAANRAISSFTETWAREGAPEVRVNELMLGLFETRHAQGTRGWGLLSASERQSLIDHTLLKRTGRMDDVVKAVLFLIRDADYLTGSVIRLDGGFVLGGAAVPPLPRGVV